MRQHNTRMNWKVLYCSQTISLRAFHPKFKAYGSRLMWFDIRQFTHILDSYMDGIGAFIIWWPSANKVNLKNINLLEFPS